MKNNNYLFFIPAILLFAALILAAIFIFNRSSSQNNLIAENDLIIGGEKDEFGCLIAAGYSWCEPARKCLRIWEEPCFNDLSQEEIAALKQMFVDKYQRAPEEIEVIVSQYEGDFIKGGVRFALNGEFNGGGIFLAYKKNNSWQLAFDGNGMYNCEEMLGYNFPENFLIDCKNN